APYLKHAVGHGLSKKVHDKPSISPRSADIFKAGQVIAIEPGVYLKGKLGIRIEDTVLVGKNPAALSKFTKNLITVKLAK
ncbi:MAG: M24 family metallopeptidase, partial [DPANN group archaeon]|nr:M24 family metallopeptidase [DPANN group archaeon]